MDPQLPLDEFKAVIQLRWKKSITTCESCGEGINVFLRTPEESERLIKTFQGMLKQYDWRVFMHVTMAQARGCFYPLAMLSFLGLLIRQFVGEYDILSALTLMTIFWGFMMVTMFLASLLGKKMQDRKALKAEINALTEGAKVERS